MSVPEAWLAGPIDGIPALLMPVAHAVTQAEADVAQAVADLSVAEVWARPGGVASVGFHLRHLAASTERLLTYAEGRGLSDAQRAAIAGEGEPGLAPPPASELLLAVTAAMERVRATLRNLPEDELLAPRAVGRARLPTTVLGLLYHIGEHAARHAGQMVTTAKLLRAGRIES